MKKYFFLIKICLIALNFCQAQQNPYISWQSVNSGGTNLLTSGNPKISQTVGQTATTTLTNGNIKLTQGFQQGMIAWSLSSNENKPSFAQVKIFPNPTSDILQIDIDELFLNNATYEWNIINLEGQILRKGNITNTSEFIDVSTLPQSQYFLKLFVRDKTTNLNYIAKFLKIK